jgi:hypothetical protein
MTRLISCGSALFLTAAAVFTASVNQTSAAPAQPFAVAPGSRIVLIECKQGEKNCTTGTVHPGSSLTPKKTEIPDNGWQDPDCKDFKNCGYASSPDAKKNGAGAGVAQPTTANKTK